MSIKTWQERQNGHDLGLANQGNMQAEIDELRAALAERDSHLGNLLARCHRDGGQYQELHGTKKAVRDADIAVATVMASNDELRAKLAALETHNTMLRACIKGMIKVADRKTDEFDAAKELLAAGAAPVPDGDCKTCMYQGAPNEPCDTCSRLIDYTDKYIPKEAS